MSLRPQLRGFKWEKMQALFGGRDPAVVAEVEHELASLWREYAEEDEDEAAETQRSQMDIVRRAVESGVPFADLAQETEDHYDVALAFAAVHQQAVITKISEWGAPTFPDFLMRFGHCLPPQSRALFSFFTDGRPLFGARGDRGYGPYAFLSRAEALGLDAGFR
jgi:hypothetical protein